jgi:hypothetical protein
MLPRLRREAQEEAAAQYARLLSGDDPHAQEYERRQLELRSGR